MTLYGTLQAVLPPLLRTAFSFKVTGLEHIPQTGGAIIAANHISLLDPPVLGASLSRPVHFMAKKELFSNPAFGWLIEKLNAFPVQRGAADRVAIRKALLLLEQGQLIGIFPEGTRSKNGLLGSPEPGVALIAAKAGVPVIPVAIAGTNAIGRSWRLPQFTVAFGSPVYPAAGKTDREALDRLSAAMMQAIGGLLGQSVSD
ncbi:MAG: lysophospholipid acyltransferase family protein [Sporomusaceae bacterium]|nr:lysophospholipid acyltransferase family protein [Sporomusaceae bacterium]